MLKQSINEISAIVQNQDLEKLISLLENIPTANLNTNINIEEDILLGPPLTVTLVCLLLPLDQIQTNKLLQIAESLIYNGARLDKSIGYEILLKAIENECNIHLAKILVDNGVDVNKQKVEKDDKELGKNLLYLALQNQHSKELVELLLAAGAKVDSMPTDGLYTAKNAIFDGYIHHGYYGCRDSKSKNKTFSN